SKCQSQWCHAVWDEKQPVAEAFTPDGDVGAKKLSCGYSVCGGPVVQLPDNHPRIPMVYEDTIMMNLPPPQDEFPF
ncbi:MAG TPA: hypothetical protein VJ987_07210, partial [Anaerolineales bacterium]|nr:hypothetical protein [Anaerolineales bacterium]